MLTGVTDRYFADGGHALDFTNKAFESLDIIGWEHAPAILPTVVELAWWRVDRKVSVL